MKVFLLVLIETDTENQQLMSVDKTDRRQSLDLPQ